VKVSIVIPTVNEAETIPLQVRRCLALSPRPEVIVADGGSTDETLGLAEKAGAFALACPVRGRARQMNAGASRACGDVLLFLHADVTLPQEAYTAMRRALHDPDVIGGAFRRRFDGGSRLLRLGCRLADLRGAACGIFLGDQAMFLRRDRFHRLGGFPEMLLFEDLALSLKLRRLGTTRFVRATVVASGRRFRREGNLRRLARNLWLTFRYFTGADPDHLARGYYPGYFVDPGDRQEKRLAGGKVLGGRP